MDSPPGGGPDRIPKQPAGNGAVTAEWSPWIFIERSEGGEEYAWLTEFGVAKLLTGRTTLVGRLIAGTPCYMAPELITGKQS
jgi:hypothetical protein